MFIYERVEMAGSERDRETEKLRLTEDSSHWHRAGDTYSEPCFFDGMFNTEPFLSRGAAIPSWHLLAGCFPNLSLMTLLSLYNILNAHDYFFQFSIHVIYFCCPLVTQV